MSKLEVQSIRAKEPFSNDYGTMYPFTLMGLLDGQLDSVDMNFKKPESAPKVGETLEVTVEEGKYGKKAKKVQANTFSGGGKGGYEKPANNRSFAASYAKDIIVAQLATKTPPEKPVDEMLKYADAILKWLEGSVAPASGIKELVESELGNNADPLPNYDAEPDTSPFDD